MKSQSLSKISRLLVALLIASMLTPVLAFAADFRNVTYDGDTVRGSVYVDVYDAVYGNTVDISVYDGVYHVATTTSTTYSVYEDVYYVYDFAVTTGAYGQLDLSSVAGAVTSVTYSAYEPPTPAPVAINDVTISSNNADPTKAKVGDMVTLTFTTNEEVFKLGNFKINGSNPTSFESNNISGTWTNVATYILEDSDPEGLVNFQINVKNAAGVYSVTTEATTNGSSVEVFKAPVISAVNLVSSNADQAKAKVGDAVTLTFTTNQEVFKLGNFKINGSNPTSFSSTGSGNNWTTVATYVIEGSDPVGPVNFQINVKNIVGLYSITTEATTDGSGVTVVASPVTPLAPFVTKDDVNNVIVDADDTMEYSTDGGSTWTGYDPYDPPTFPGNVTVYVRVADDGFNLAGESTVLTFTANTPTPTPEPTTPPEPTPTPTPTPTPSNPAPEPTPGTPTPEPTPANPTPTPSTPTPTPGSPTPAPTAPPTTSPDPGPSNPTPAPTAPPTSNPTPTPSSPTPTPTTPTGPTPTPTAPPADNSFINIKVADLIAALLKAIEEVKAAGIPHFSDTDSHWAQSNISVFTQIGAIDGYEDGTFRPDASVTRAEFAAILARVFNFTGTGSKFSDVTGHWAQDEIAALAASGIIDGYEDGTFQPNKTITRAEIISMVSKMVNLAKAKQVSDTTFHDTSGVWNADQIDQAAKAGIINGREAGAFAPNAFSTRAEALTIILNVLELSPELKAIIEKLR